MDSAKQEVSLFVVDENKQRDNDTYIGLLQFETADNDRTKTKGDLPISMPKVGIFVCVLRFNVPVNNVSVMSGRSRRMGMKSDIKYKVLKPLSASHKM